MKKILLLLITISTVISTYAQFPEDFEGTTFPPTGWAVFIGANGTGTGSDWVQAAYGGQMAAYVQYEAGGLNEDWLVTPQFTVDAALNTLSFDQDDTYDTDYGTTYYVKVSTASQTTHADFTDVDTQTETDVHTVGTNLANHTVDLSAYIGQQIYVAFVMVQNDGDDWYIDNVNMISPVTCGVPTDMTSSNQTTSSFDVSWTTGTVGTASNYSIEYGPLDFAQGSGTTINSNTTSTSISGLTEGTGYDVYVQSDCGASDGMSTWAKSSFFTSASPYAVGCGFNNPSNDIENGSSCNGDVAAGAYIDANDILVPANTTMSLSKIVPHILLLPGDSALTVDVMIYDDNAGLPGNVISTQAGIVPTSSKQTGTNFGFILNELELDLTPIDLINATAAVKTFWIGISVYKAAGVASNCFWETTSASIEGVGVAFNDGSGFSAVNPVVDGVYSFVASCNTASIKDNQLSSQVSIYPTTTKNNFTINNKSNTALTSVSLYDVNGRMVLTKNLDNLVGERTINVSNLETGMYFVQLNSTNATVTKKLIKN